MSNPLNRPVPIGARNKDNAPVYKTYGHTLRDLCRAKTEDAVQTLYDIMVDTGMPANARVKAAENLLDRGYGKPVQYVEPKNPEAGDVANMTDQELADFIAENQAAAEYEQAQYDDVLENSDLDPDQPELDELNAAKSRGQVN